MCVVLIVQIQLLGELVECHVRYGGEVGRKSACRVLGEVTEYVLFLRYHLC